MKRDKPYLGDDPARFIHSSRTHRTISEAFRDADYAYSGWIPRSEWEDVVAFCSGFAIMLPVIAFVGYIFYLVIKAKGY